MTDCIFCKIVKKEIPANIIYEDENFLAFLDINPVSYGHTLIVPKKHIIWMHEANDSLISEIFKLAKRIMLAIKNGMKSDYVQLSVVGKDVPHFHIHLKPRKLSDDIHDSSTKKYEKGKSEEVALKITQAL